jgi:DNA-binding winged helix-turn-helix (wHTH) protein
MIYRFGDYELDAAAFELRANGAALELEPQVFALLALLLENRERLVSKDEIVEKIWDGRDISDAAIASRIKSARRVLGDDGKSQRFIKTIHGVGFRFAAPVTITQARSQTPSITVDDRTLVSGAATHDGVTHTQHPMRPSIAVLPFQAIGTDELCKALAVAVPDEIIGELSHLRSGTSRCRVSVFRLPINRQAVFRTTPA